MPRLRVDAERRFTYADARVTKVHQDSFDVITADGVIFKYIPNTTNTRFGVGRYVSIMFYNDDRRTCRIVGKGKYFTEKSSVKILRIEEYSGD